MTFMKLSTYLVTGLFIIGCSTPGGSPLGAVSRKSQKHLKSSDDGTYSTPCINLPFIDRNFPHLLGDVIRLHDPKVDPVGAYKISRLLLKQERKQKKYVIDTSSVKLCRLGDEMGYSFTAVNVVRK